MLRTLFAPASSSRSFRIRGAVIASLALLALLFAAPALAQSIGDAVSGDLTPADAITLAGASIVVSILVGALFSALGWTDAQGGGAKKDRYGPLVAILVGVVVVGGFAFAQGADIVAAVLTGVIAGNGAMGVHDLVGVATG